MCHHCGYYSLCCTVLLNLQIAFILSSKKTTSAKALKKKKKTKTKTDSKTKELHINTVSPSAGCCNSSQVQSSTSVHLSNTAAACMFSIPGSLLPAQTAVQARSAIHHTTQK